MHWPLDLQEFFKEVLCKNKTYSWSEIYSKFLFESNLTADIKALI